MKKVFFALLFALSLLATNGMQAQNEYDNALGLRLGRYNGVTFKHFMNGKGAAEVILTTHPSYGWSARLLYEHHLPFFDVNQMNWYFGGGLYAGFYGNHSTLGLVGDLGLEYTFKAAPFCISLDWQPWFPIVNRYNYNRFVGDGGAFSIRYTF